MNAGLIPKYMASDKVVILNTTPPKCGKIVGNGYEDAPLIVQGKYKVKIASFLTKHEWHFQGNLAAACSRCDGSGKMNQRGGIFQKKSVPCDSCCGKGIKIFLADPNSHIPMGGLRPEQFKMINVSYPDGIGPTGSVRNRLYRNLIEPTLRECCQIAELVVLECILEYLEPPPDPVRILVLKEREIEGPQRDIFRGMALMLFPSSGRRGFSPILPDGRLNLSESIASAMVNYEVELRNSQHYQALFDLYNQIGWMISAIIDAIQWQVVREFGFNDINVLRSLATRFPLNSTIMDTFYIKYNRCQANGIINIGDTVPDIPLYTPKGELTSLNGYYQKLCNDINPGCDAVTTQLPLVLVCGSGT